MLDNLGTPPQTIDKYAEKRSDKKRIAVDTSTLISTKNMQYVQLAMKRDPSNESRESANPLLPEKSEHVKEKESSDSTN